MSSPPAPPVNRRIEVRVPGEPRWLASRVEDHDELLTIAAPTGASGAADSPPAGAAVAIRWTERRGIGLLDAVVAGTQTVPVPLWHLRVVGAAEIVQRRQYARVPISLPARVGTVDDEWTLITLDLSEGGMRATALAGPFLVAGPDERFVVALEVDGRTVRARARVVRCTVVQEALVVTFCFTDIAPADADHLRRFVFDREIRLRDVLR